MSINAFTVYGFIYVDQRLEDRSTSWPEPSLIDPGLPVDAHKPDHAGTAMRYGVPYRQLSPACRGAYLHWLANGRCASDIHIGYVFLYFFGLERRLVLDVPASHTAQRERAALRAEISRLAGVYGQEASFGHYADGLLAATFTSGARRYLSPPPTQRNGWTLPFDLELGIGQLIEDRKPIPADWALAWVRLHPEAWLRTPATRCIEEFDQLFVQKYRDRYGHGLRTTTSPGKRAEVYRPANPSLGGYPVHLPATVPDVAALSSQFAELRELARDVCTDLDEYSRFMGRHPDAAGTAAALALLPASVQRSPDRATRAFLSWADGCLATSEFAEVAGVDLLARWSGTSNDRLARPEASLVSRLLERSGIGMEPDVRFGGTPPSGATRLILFRRGVEVANAPSDTYTTASVAIELGATVATADGRFADIARAQLERYLAERFRLSDDEERRLRAHLAYIFSHPPTANALRKRVSALSEPRRRAIGQLLVAVAAADGAVSQGEADALVRLYRMLDLDPSEVDSRAGATAASDRLARLRTNGERTRDYALPNPRRLPKDSQRRVLDLDPSVVADRVAASARAASYLDALSTDQVEEGTPAGAVTHKGAHERSPSLEDDQRLHGLGTGTFRGSPGQPHRSVTGEGVKIWHRAQEQPQVQEQQAKKPTVMLDPKVVAARLAESDKVATYLAEVFTNEDTLTSMTVPPGLVQRQSEEGIAGLDQAHSGLLRRLAERDRWSRADFDSITAELGLMPDGALDTLNEVAIDVAGEPVCEGPDPIQMNKCAIEEMLQ